MKLIVRKDCPNCEYIVNQLKKLGLLDRIEVVEDDNAEVTPAIEVDGEREPVMGNIYGLVKIVLYMKKKGLLNHQ